MNGFKRFCLGLFLTASLGALLGCEDKPITISYDCAPEYRIPTRIRRIGVAEFGGKTSEDRKFGNIAADHLASALDAYNKKYDRYELVDRKRLQAILDERDLQLAISDSASAGQVGKVAHVDAMIYGSVSVSSRDEQGSTISFDISTQRPKKVYYTKRYCMVSVNFTMDDISTSKTLTTVTLTREYDSDKDKKIKGIGKALGFSGNDLPPVDQIYGRLIQDCVGEFISKISPHTLTHTVKMERGKSKIVERGNKFARAGDYDEALECYMRALEISTQDDGAAFNAALMYEAKGDLQKAREYYSKAFELKDKEKYLTARNRVRREAK